MFIIFLRAIVTFIALFIIMRLMGKRQIGEMQPFEFVITLVISELACIPMADISIPLLYGIVAVVALFILHQVVSILEQKGVFFKKLISGKPSIVINKDGIDFFELKKNNLDVEDLIESMRSYGYYSLDDLEYGIFEANGKFNGIEKENYEKKPPTLPLILISSGKTHKDNLKLSGLTLEKVEREIIKNGIKKIK